MSSDKQRGNAQIGVRLPPELMAAAKQAAEEEERAVAWLMRRAFQQWLEAHGYLEPPRSQPTPD